MLAVRLIDQDRPHVSQRGDRHDSNISPELSHASGRKYKMSPKARSIRFFTTKFAPKIRLLSPEYAIKYQFYVS